MRGKAIIISSLAEDIPNSDFLIANRSKSYKL